MTKARRRMLRRRAVDFGRELERVAFEHGLPVIDLRAVCDRPRDYANPIEPSGRGGRKIARAVARACGALDQAAAPSRVSVS